MSTKLNIVLEQGSDFWQSYQLANIETKEAWDISGFSGKFVIRQDQFSDEYHQMIDLLCSGNTVTLDIPGSLSVDFIPGSYLYTMDIFKGSERYRILEGNIQITPSMFYSNSKDGYYAR